MILVVLTYLDRHWWSIGWPQTVSWVDEPETKLEPGMYRLEWKLF